MKRIINAALLSSLLFWAPQAQAQRAGRTVEAVPQRPQPLPAPLPDVTLISRFNTLSTTGAALAADMPKVYSLHQASSGGSIAFVTPSVVWGDNAGVSFIDGHLTMQLGDGMTGPHLFDCSFSGVSQVQYKYG